MYTMTIWPSKHIYTQSNGSAELYFTYKNRVGLLSVSCLYSSHSTVHGHKYGFISQILLPLMLHIPLQFWTYYLKQVCLYWEQKRVYFNRKLTLSDVRLQAAAQLCTIMQSRAFPLTLGVVFFGYFSRLGKGHKKVGMSFGEFFDT